MSDQEATDHQARVRRLTPADLNDEQQILYDRIVSASQAQGPPLFQVIDSSGALEGPFNGYLHQPALGAVLQDLGDAMRDDASLTSRARELAILVVAAHCNADFARYAHEAIGRAVGLTDVEMAGVRDRRYEVIVNPFERAVVDTTDQLASRGDLSDAECAAVVEKLGEAMLLELLTLVGFYSLLILQMRVLRVGVPAQ
ncbi:MAG: carboxymuconolactone decarboxylase family protein [Actinobacteria bacterium]|nr:carboxymuconolactone decarboxylase family protein [Actinomycetota bacterium]